jgi:hypothetical protein
MSAKNEKNPMDEKYPHTCHQCSKPLKFLEMCNANTKMEPDHLKKLWKSQAVEFLCCRCFTIIEELKKKLQYHSILEPTYENAINYITLQKIFQPFKRLKRKSKYFWDNYMRIPEHRPVNPLLDRCSTVGDIERIERARRELRIDYGQFEDWIGVPRGTHNIDMYESISELFKQRWMSFHNTMSYFDTSPEPPHIKIRRWIFIRDEIRNHRRRLL